MSAPNLATEASLAPAYPYLRFNPRERKLLESVKTYVDAQVAAAAPFAIIASGTFTTAGGDAAESITATGALATDRAIVMVRTAGATPRSIVAAAAATNAINVTMSGDPSTDHVLCWFVVRDI